ncbi:MAG: hypothetical protein UX71_C0003G0044 [Parcubacteria group bacterium GW2011_GWA1_47_10]|nr:MAG: hypothetical protein UX71_C0003G0044 [Parcubacteria group bacterium GW2011_GWA1_47_10]
MTGLTVQDDTIVVDGYSSGIYAGWVDTTPHSGWLIGGSGHGNTIEVNSGAGVTGDGMDLYDVSDSEVSYNTITLTNPTDSTPVIWSSELSNLNNLKFEHNTMSGSTGSEVWIGTDFSSQSPDTSISTVSVLGNTFGNWGVRALKLEGSVTGVSVNANIFQMTADTTQVIGGTAAPSATGTGNTFNISLPAKIQKAVDAAFAGDTINVAAGTYDEQLTVDKDVTISGVSGAILQPTGNDDAWDIQFASGGSGATLEGFTLDFNGSANDRDGRGIGISDSGGPTVTNVTIQNNDITMGVGVGAATGGLEGVGIQTGLNADIGGLQILDNDFHAGSTVITDGNSQGEEGIYVNPSSGTGEITISGNTFDGELFTGISIESDNVTVSNNTVTRTSIVQNTNGIRVNEFYGSKTYSITISDNVVSGFDNGLRLGSGSDGGSTLAVTVENNTITDNTRGIWVRNDAVVTASGNTFSGNTSNPEILAGSDGTVNGVNVWGNPVVTINGDVNMGVWDRNGFSDPGASATDSSGASVDVVVTGSVNISIAGTYTLTYTATDMFGNTASADRTVTVRIASGGGGGSSNGGGGRSSGAASPRALQAVNAAGVTLPVPAAGVIGQVLGASTVSPEIQAQIDSIKLTLRGLISQLIALLQQQLAAAIASQGN